uniref:C6 domain-containing protein n=1 Tax=Angiostrongylus cantonensis TaxID=6313 RepID=A0A0K0DBQ9_ANGCA
MDLSMLPFVIISLTAACAPPGFVQSNDPGMVGARCSDLILYPVSAVDQSDQYRFDYSDVSFGNTHAQGATVAITCTTGGQPATVEGYDQTESIWNVERQLIVEDDFLCNNIALGKV